MKTSPPETNDPSRDHVTLVAFAFLTVATYVAACLAFIGLDRLSG